MIQYKYDYIPRPFGLQNNGALCYFNSLIQCLLSCSAFNESIKLFDDDCELAIKYQDLIENKNNIASAYNLATTLYQKRLQDNHQWNINPNRQEDIHEGFTLLIESLKKYDDIFSVRYISMIHCTACDHKIEIPRESSPKEIMIEIPNRFDTQEQYQNYITSHYISPSKTIKQIDVSTQTIML